MRENQLSVHYTSAEETGRVRPALDSGDGGAHIPCERVTHVEARAAGNYKLGTWLLASAVISVTTLYTICNPKWVPSSVVQTVKISNQLSDDIKRRASSPLGGTAVTDTAKAGTGTVADAAGIHDVTTGRNSASAVHPKGETAVYGVTKAAEAKTSKSKKGFLVPPPPPTPCVLPPGFGLFPMQPAQQYAALQQQLQQAQAQASPLIHNQSAARENTPQQSDQELQAADRELQAADQKLQAALRSSLLTDGEWKR
jgi:hypothetical protein